MDWSLLGCGRYGHITFAPAEPELRVRLHAQLADGEAWRCLRCGAFVPGKPDLSGPARSAPVVPRGREIRSKFILRLFALERFLRALIFAVAAVALWRYRYSRSSVERAFDRGLPIVRGLFRQLGFNIDHSKLVGLLQHALTLSNGSLTLLAAGAAGYAVLEVVEGTGLWLARRWGEYFAMIATSLGLPLEIYDLTRKVTLAALALLAVNVALVLYLLITKRLFGARGGKKAYAARLHSESVLGAARLAVDGTEEPATARGQVAPPATCGQAAAARDQAAATGDQTAATRDQAAATGDQAAATGGQAPATGDQAPRSAAESRSPDPAARVRGVKRGY